MNVISGGQRVLPENLLRVFEAVHDSPGITRGEVARATGLSLSTVARAVSQLRRAGLLTSTGSVPPSVGRHAEALAINREHVLVAGLDVGEVWIRAAIADLAGTILSTIRVPTEPARGMASVIDRIQKVVTDLSQAAGRRPAVIVVGHTGFVEPQSGLLRAAPHIPGADGFPILSELQRRFEGAHIAVDNDVNLAALGETWQGAAARRDKGEMVVLLSFRTGIGAGIVVNGSLYQGMRGASGEVGYLCGDVAWALQSPGAAGWVETKAGGPAIVSSYRVRASGGGSGPASGAIQDLEALLEAYQQGDPGAVEALEEAMGYYGLVLADIVAVLDPHLVVLGGIVPTLGERALRRVVSVASRMVPWLPPVVLSSLGLDATMYGAVYQASRLALDRVKVRLATLSANGGESHA